MKELCLDAVSQDGGNKLENELRESQFTVNLLTLQIQELQEIVNSMSAFQNFKDLQTASSSGSAHASGKPQGFPRFSSQLRRAARLATVLMVYDCGLRNTGNLDSAERVIHKICARTEHHARVDSGYKFKSQSARVERTSSNA